MLQNDGHDLPADRDDRVQGGHGILEYGGNAAAADLFPVGIRLHTRQIEHASAEKLLLIFAFILHIQRSISQDPAAFVCIIQAFSCFESLFDGGIKLLQGLVSVLSLMSGRAQIEFLRHDLVSGFHGIGERLLNQRSILFVQTLMLGFIMRVVRGIRKKRLLMLFQKFFFSALQRFDLRSHAVDLRLGFSDLCLFFGRVEGLLLIEGLRPLELQIIDLSVDLRFLFRRQRQSVLPLILQCDPFLINFRTEFQRGQRIQLRLYGLHEAAAGGILIRSCLCKLVIVKIN